jgi:DNA-binding LacI/PurR family transcriptional regulator
MQQVAQRAGVTPMTVSRVLNGGSTSAATRASVQRAIDELGYRPHLGAQALKSRKTRQVGVLLENNPELPCAHPLAWEFVLGINAGLEEGRHAMSLIRLTDIVNDVCFGSRILEGRLLDGIIVVNRIPQRVAERVEELYPNCVWVDANVWRDERCLRRNEHDAGRTVAVELAKLGYRRFVILSCADYEAGTPVHFSFDARRRGISEVAQQRGIELCEVKTDMANDGFSQIPQLQPLFAPDTAIVALDMYSTVEFLVELSATQWRAGIDFGIACCDDYFHDNRLHGISRVSFNRYQMGLQAAEMMLQLLQQPDAECSSRMIRGEWVPGATVRPVSC